MGRACAIVRHKLLTSVLLLIASHLQNFARAGCKLVLHDVKEAGLDRTIKEAKVDKSNVTKAVFDLKQDGALEELIHSVPKKHGRLDYAVYVHRASLIKSSSVLRVGGLQERSRHLGRLPPVP